MLTGKFEIEWNTWNTKKNIKQNTKSILYLWKSS